VLPTLAGLAGLGGALAPWAELAHSYEWLTIPLSAVFLGYANYVTFIKRQGQRRARIAVGLLTVVTVLAWGHVLLHR